MKKFLSKKSSSFFKDLRFASALKRPYSIEELKGRGIVAIRREDKNRWERRAPLAPKHVEELTKKGVEVLVQPSNLRIFSDHQYKNSGATITEDISPASVILGVKEVPLNKLIPNRTYCFFSHTIKAQKKNMPLLDSILEKNIRLIDYEKIVQDNQRLVKFGQFAGYAGMIDFLHGLGDRMLTFGYSTPFLHLGYTHMYTGMQAAIDAVKDVGEQITQQGLPDIFCPLVFVFTGTGSVQSGAKQIFELLPHEWVTKEQMHEMFQKRTWRRDVVYGTIASSDQIVQPIDPNKEFNKYEYYREPHRYESIFAEDYGRYASVIVNCMYWDANFPRILTTEQIHDLHRQRKLRLLGVADLSCDIEGGIEVLKTTSSIDHPFFVYDLNSRKIQWDVSKTKGILFLAVDNLPTEIPKDATTYFGDALLPFIEPLAFSDGSKPFEEQTDLPEPIRSAIITSHGRLTPNFTYIQELRKKTEVKTKDYKKVVVLGSGMVSGPVIDFFGNDVEGGFRVVIATNEVDKAEKIRAGRPNISVLEWDANDVNSLKLLISDSDVVISLLPASMHVSVAQACIEKGVSLVTTSYTSKEMQELDQKAQAAQVTIMNEIGLDPGIDHLEAMRVINEAKEKGGEVVSFVSWCGGLPAPEASDNPFAYKFSWSPRGALIAGTQGAIYKQGDRTIELAPGTIFQNKQKVSYFPGFNLEGYSNRDSVSYIKQYGLNNPKTFFRGTLRYAGFCDVLDALLRIGYLDNTPTDRLTNQTPETRITWRELTTSLVPGASIMGIEDTLLSHLGLSQDNEEKAARVEKAFQWLGLFSDEYVPPAPTILDALCNLMISKMSFQEGEKDLIILVHDFVIKYKNGDESYLRSSLVAYGDNQYSAMARTVGFPAAIAAKLIMNGHIIRRGVVKPLTPDIYVPILSHLNNNGISFKHTTY